MTSIDYFNRDFGNEDSGSGNSTPTVDYFARDFGDVDSENANKKNQPISTPVASYSDIPISQDATASDYAPLGAGISRGTRNVGESISNAQLWAANKLGVLSDKDYQDVADIRKNRLNGYNSEFGNNRLSKLGVTEGELAASLPLLSAGGELAGAAAEGIPAIGSGIEALQGNKFGRILSNAAKGSAIGATGNALISAGNESPLGDQLKQGAEVGGTLGVGIPLVTDATKYISNKISDLFASPQDYAATKVIQAASRDQIPLGELQNRLTQMGDQANIADVGGKNILRLADTVGNIPGEGQEKIAQFLNERQAGQNERLMSSAAMGLKINPEVNYEGTIDDLIAQRKEAATPLYEKAFNASPVSNDRIDQFLQDPILQSGLKKGLQIQRLESLADGKPFNPSDYAIKGWDGDYETGQPILEKTPNMRLLDSAKKGLDSIISDNTDQFGKVNELGRAVTKVKNSYLGELDILNPDYAMARASYSKPSQSFDAIKKGSDFVKNGSYGNAKELANMSDQDKQFFRIGVGKTISDMLDGTREGSDAASKLFATPKMQKALESVFPSESEFNKFSDAVKNEIQFYANRRAILGGSPTAPRLASMSDIGQPATVDFGDIAHAAKGNYGGAALSIGSKIKNKLTQMSPEKADAISNILFSSNPESAVNSLRSFATPTQPGSIQRFIGGNYLPVTNFGINRLLDSFQSNPR